VSEADGQLYYKVRWKGYGSDDDTEEPATEIAHCVDIVEEWEATKATQRRRSGMVE
jgi:hypothetical protein